MGSILAKTILKDKIDSLRVNGISNFVLDNNGHKFEFKIITVAGEQYKVFGGYGMSLRTFHKFNDSNEIAHEFIMALKGMDMKLENCIFVNPMHFK